MRKVVDWIAKGVVQATLFYGIVVVLVPVVAPIGYTGLPTSCCRIVAAALVFLSLPLLCRQLELFRQDYHIRCYLGCWRNNGRILDDRPSYPSLNPLGFSFCPAIVPLHSTRSSHHEHYELVRLYLLCSVRSVVTSWSAGTAPS